MLIRPPPLAGPAAHGDRAPPSPALGRRLARHTALLLLALFVLTMGGHTSSPDEESLVYMTRSLVEHGRLDIPPEGFATTALLAPGADGRLYAPYGPLPALLLAPFHVAGRVAGTAFDPRFSEYIVRLFCSLLDPLLTASTAAVLLTLALDLGASGTTGVALALCYGVATMAWPYSRWLWAEPATALALLLAVLWTSRALRSKGRSAPLLAGFAFALAAATKLPTLVTLPGFLLVLALPLPLSLGRRAGRIAAFLAAPIAAAAALMAVNVARFGRPFETGYQALGAGAGAFDWGSREGILGLLLSPGKSLFVYSPPLLLGLVAIPWLARRAPRETLLVVWLAAAHVFLYGSFRNWHGDASWGPRYLMPIVAPLLLPALALLDSPGSRTRRLARMAFWVLCGLGVAVQLPAVLLDYAAYTVRSDRDGEPGKRARRFELARAPLVGHVRMLRERLGEWRARVPADIVLASGFSWPEGDRGSPLPRWTSAMAEIDLRVAGTARIEIDYVDFRPRSLEPARITVASSDGTRPAIGGHFDPASQRGTLVITTGTTGTTGTKRATDTTRALGTATRTLTLTVNPWRPGEDAGLDDERELGVFVRRIRGQSNGRELEVAAAQIPRLPVSPERAWSKEAFAWFHDPPHLLDSWIWHLWFSGLPRALVLLAALPALLLAIEGWALWRALREGAARTAAPGSAAA